MTLKGTLMSAPTTSDPDRGSLHIWLPEISRICSRLDGLLEENAHCKGFEHNLSYELNKPDSKGSAAFHIFELRSTAMTSYIFFCLNKHFPGTS